MNLRRSDRPSQQKRELQEHVNDPQDVEQFKDREPAIGEVSRTFMCVSDQHHASEADVPGRMIIGQQLAAIGVILQAGTL